MLTCCSPQHVHDLNARVNDLCHRYRAITLIWSPVIYLAMQAGIQADPSFRRSERGQPCGPSARQRITTFIAPDYYLDGTKTLMEVAIMFLTQCSLLGFYLLGLYTDGTPNFSNGKVFAFYYAGASSPPCDAHYVHVH